MLRGKKWITAKVTMMQVRERAQYAATFGKGVHRERARIIDLLILAEDEGLLTADQTEALLKRIEDPPRAANGRRARTESTPSRSNGSPARSRR